MWLGVVMALGLGAWVPRVVDAMSTRAVALPD
jgi:hypothetical protein